MKKRLATYLALIKGHATPGQWAWVSRAMFFTGCAMLWRAFQTVHPSAVLSVVGLGVFATGAVCYVNLIFHSPRLKAAGKWSLVVMAGGFCNFAVIIANGGLMPAVNQQVVAGMYCPIDGANLPLLADWIFGFASPGDVLMIGGGVGILAGLARRRTGGPQLCTGAKETQ